MIAEICLSMAGAEQSKDTWFILVPAGAVRPAAVCSGALYCLHCGARRGVATSEAGEKAWPPSPRGLIEASANIVGKAENV
jgi:tRNA threonylcarbamoyladenosine modification (KEOPS) complex Cgi121 subunit